jgi:polysaccharide deacetylase family protein (PEP-CTERM system associated)
MLLLSIDFEDWHQLVHRRLGRSDWDKRGPALERQTEVVLTLLDELGVKATFFVLGITAARYPELLQEIAARGHEIASHGHAHERVHAQTADSFRADVQRGLETIEARAGVRPIGFRAPAFSITRATPWAYDVLGELGFEYDSSQYDSPRVPNRIAPIPRAPYRLRAESGADSRRGRRVLARAPCLRDRPHVEGPDRRRRRAGPLLPPLRVRPGAAAGGRRERSR